MVAVHAEKLKGAEVPLTVHHSIALYCFIKIRSFLLVSENILCSL